MVNNESLSVTNFRELKFAILPTLEFQNNQRQNWEIFVKEMEKVVGIPIKTFHANSYADVIEAITDNKAQIAWHAARSYIKAAQEGNVEAFAQLIFDDGNRGYYSHLIINKNNPILQRIKALGTDQGDEYTIKNAAKLTFAFNDFYSTSGFLVPSYYLFARNGIMPENAFRNLFFLGTHEATALAVANGQVDIATNNNESLIILEKNNPEARKKLEVIWTSPIIPSYPIAYRNDLPENLKKRIQDFFYNYKDQKVLRPLGWGGFDKANDNTWDIIRELEVKKTIEELKFNRKLSENQKKQEFKRLENKLREIHIH